jgi:hypothetical protein
MILIFREFRSRAGDEERVLTAPEDSDTYRPREANGFARRALRQCGSGARFATENLLGSPLQAIASRLWGSPT